MMKSKNVREECLDEREYYKDTPAWMKQVFRLLKETADTEIKQIGPCGILNQSYQTTQFGNLSHLYASYQQ
jgi:hypothetical protein